MIPKSIMADENIRHLRCPSWRNLLPKNTENKVDNLLMATTMPINIIPTALAKKKLDVNFDAVNKMSQPADSFASFEIVTRDTLCKNTNIKI